jgi:hypothetical protein
MTGTRDPNIMMQYKKWISENKLQHLLMLTPLRNHWTPLLAKSKSYTTAEMTRF